MELEKKGISCIRGYHWTTDGGYVQPEWRGRYFFNDMGAKCVDQAPAIRSLFGQEQMGHYIKPGLYQILSFA